MLTNLWFEISLLVSEDHGPVESGLVPNLDIKRSSLIGPDQMLIFKIYIGYEYNSCLTD